MREVLGKAMCRCLRAKIFHPPSPHRLRLRPFTYTHAFDSIFSLTQSVVPAEAVVPSNAIGSKAGAKASQKEERDTS